MNQFFTQGDLMTPEEIEQEKKVIDKMSQTEMASLHRFAPAGHKYFVTGSELHKHFSERFKQLGGMTPEISKQIGW